MCRFFVVEDDKGGAAALAIKFFNKNTFFGDAAMAAEEIDNVVYLNFVG